MRIKDIPTGLYKIPAPTYDILIYNIKDFNIFIKYVPDDDAIYAPARYHFHDLSISPAPMTEKNLKNFPTIHYS